MKFVTLLIGLNILIFSARAESTEETESDLIDHAVFAEDSRQLTLKQEGRQTFGLLVQDFSGLGLIYNRGVGNDRNLWASVAYKSNSQIFLEEFQATSEVANAEVEQKYQAQLMVGIDQTVHLTTNKYWGVILGLGVGVSRAEYESSYYRQLCGLFCGFDPSSAQRREDVHTHGFLLGRVGVAFRKTRLFGTDGDIAVTIAPVLASTNELRLTGPDRRVLNSEKLTPWYIEATIEL